MNEALELLTSASLGHHVVQTYHDEQNLVATIGAYALQGLKKGEKIILVGSQAHLEGIRKHLIPNLIDLASLERSKQLFLLDARSTLAKFMMSDMPSEPLFRSTIGNLIESLNPFNSKVRIWGEMVNLLWEDGNSVAAIQLEEHWNKLGKEFPFFLFCTYVIDSFDPNHSQMSHKVLKAHSGYLPCEDYNKIEKALDMALTEMWGPTASMMKKVFVDKYKEALREIPRIQVLISWLQKEMPVSYKTVLNRAKTIYETQLKIPLPSLT